VSGTKSKENGREEESSEDSGSGDEFVSNKGGGEADPEDRSES